MMQIAKGSLADRKLAWKKEAAACVVMAVDGYPGEVPRGLEIAIDAIDDPSIVLFHAGTARKNGKLVTVAGRVLSVCAHAPTLTDALRRAYAAVPKIRYQGARWRNDIGFRALEYRKNAASE